MAANLERVGETLPALTFLELPVNNDRESIVANVRKNHARGLPEIQQREFVDTPLIIVAGGPSLESSLPILRALRGECHVLAVNGAYKYLRTKGIECDHFILIDSRADNVTHVDAPGKGTNHFLASQVHPAVFDALGAHKVTMFNLATKACMDALDGCGEMSFLSAPIGMASVHAVYLGASLGYRNQFLFGYDFSHKPGQTYAFDQHMNANDGSLEVYLNGQTYRTTYALARTAQQFVKAVSPIIRSCAINIRIFSDGLLPDMIKSALNVSEETERAKYEQIWEISDYRRVAPAMEFVQEAVDRLGIKHGQSIADYGCGTGRATKWFADQGFEAVGIDIAENALEEDVPFVRQALWHELPKTDFGFSTDVIEHIPPNKVRETLEAMRDATRLGCYLNIDTIDDSFGVRIGQPLHLSVMEFEQWEELIREVWPHVEGRKEAKHAIFVCRKEI